MFLNININELILKIILKIIILYDIYCIMTLCYYMIDIYI